MTVPTQKELVIEQALCDVGFSLVARLAMQTRVQVSSTDIRQHAVRKRTASEAGPSRPSKRHQTSVQVRAAPAPVVASTPTEESDASSASVPEPILALSASTVLPIVSSEERAARETTEAPSVVPSTEEVRVEIGEPE
uniref:Uncharacterized protein LOC114912857 n=1 Tax=Elaeis guineensis var. tenera TaxID=51953 RepID=A0A8N4EQN0_ELAGV|nr:uncharacterized protein LOC114912857 [Elaeis guineensis]